VTDDIIHNAPEQGEENNRKDQAMETRPFRVDSRIVPPVALAVAFGCLLLVLEGPTRRGILLAALLAPFYYLAAEILARRIVVDEKGITISKLLRSVRYEWPEISSVSSVRTGSKVFLVLHSEERGTTLITNTIGLFGELAAIVLSSAPRASVADADREQLSDPPGKVGPLVQAWIACLVLAALSIGKLLGYS
jgi:hypothetical protein